MNGGASQKTVHISPPQKEVMRPVSRNSVLCITSVVAVIALGFVLSLSSQLSDLKSRLEQMTSSAPAPEAVPQSVPLLPTVRPGMVQVGTPRPTSSSSLPTLKEQSSLVPTSTTASPETSATLPSVSTTVATTSPVVEATVEEVPTAAGEAPTSPSMATPAADQP